MKQVLVIHGGTSHNSYEDYIAYLKSKVLDYERLKWSDKWRNWLPSALPGVDVLLPDFPNSQNAQYDEWKIIFEKILPFLTGEVTLVGHSLGAMFLAKYLHESPLSVPVQALVLVAPGYSDETTEDLGSFALNSAVGLEKSAQVIHLFHSQDDPVVPFTELAKFQRDIPTAISHVFSDRNHFLQPTFPELVEIIQPEL